MFFGAGFGLIATRLRSAWAPWRWGHAGSRANWTRCRQAVSSCRGQRGRQALGGDRRRSRRCDSQPGTGADRHLRPAADCHLFLAQKRGLPLRGASGVGPVGWPRARERALGLGLRLWPNALAARERIFPRVVALRVLAAVRGREQLPTVVTRGRGHAGLRGRRPHVLVAELRVVERAD